MQGCMLEDRFVVWLSGITNAKLRYTEGLGLWFRNLVTGENQDFDARLLSNELDCLHIFCASCRRSIVLSATVFFQELQTTNFGTPKVHVRDCQIAIREMYFQVLKNLPGGTYLLARTDIPRYLLCIQICPYLPSTTLPQRLL